MNRSELITERLIQPEDVNFIFSTWLRNLYHGNTWFHEIPKSIFMENYHKVIEAIISNPNNTIKIACLIEDPSVITGYCIYTKNEQVLHFVYIKKAWRNIGIAKQIVPSTINTATHLTHVGLGLIKNKNIKFNPFLTP